MRYYVDITPSMVAGAGCELLSFQLGGFQPMGDLSGIIKQLITERDRINSAIATLESINSGNSSIGNFSSTPRKRTLSASARARIAAAQRARWAKVRLNKDHHSMSREQRDRMSKAQLKRYARERAAKG